MDHQSFTLEISGLKRHNQSMKYKRWVLLFFSLCLLTPGMTTRPLGKASALEAAAQNPLPVKQYLESILGPGVQVNISQESGQPARQKRRVTHDTPQVLAQKKQSQTTSNSTLNTQTQNHEETRWTYNTTETLQSIAETPGKRSITVVYPASAEHPPETVEKWVKAVVGLKAGETLVVQPYNPPPEPFFEPSPTERLWLWGLGCILLGLVIGLGAGFYWRRRQQKQKIAYNEPLDAYVTPQFIEETSHASQLQ